jgi:hypothetical protein
MRLRLASSIKTAEAVKVYLYHGVRNPEDAEKILQEGFDLTKINSQWTNGYGVSTFTKPDAVKKHFRNPEITILKLLFEGNMVAPWDAEEAVRPTAPKRGPANPQSPRDYNEALMAAGIDAVFLNTSYKGVLEVVIHNLQKIKAIELF